MKQPGKARRFAVVSQPEPARPVRRFAVVEVPEPESKEWRCEWGCRPNLHLYTGNMPHAWDCPYWDHHSTDTPF